MNQEDSAIVNTALELLEEDRAAQNKAAARGQNRAPGAGGPQYSG